MISLVLYLAADNREISNHHVEQPMNLRPTKAKHGVRVFPASEPRRWDVGAVGSSAAPGANISERS